MAEREWMLHNEIVPSCLVWIAQQGICVNNDMIERAEDGRGGIKSGGYPGDSIIIRLFTRY